MRAVCVCWVIELPPRTRPRRPSCASTGVQSQIHPFAYSGVLAAGAIVGGALRLTSRLSAVLQATLSTEVLKRDGGAAVLAVPAGWLGILVRL